MITSTNNTHAIESTHAFCLQFCVTALTVAVACPGTLLALPNVPEQRGGKLCRVQLILRPLNALG